VEKIVQFSKENAFVLAALLVGAHSAGKSAMNLKNGEGCRRCETAGVVLGAGLALWAGVELVRGWRA
jgi:hypothetical protein